MLVKDKDAWRKERPFRVPVVDSAPMRQIHNAEMNPQRIVPLRVHPVRRSLAGS